MKCGNAKLIVLCLKLSSTAAYGYYGIVMSPIIQNIVACPSVFYFIGVFLNMLTFCCGETRWIINNSKIYRYIEKYSVHTIIIQHISTVNVYSLTSTFTFNFNVYFSTSHCRQRQISTVDARLIRTNHGDGPLDRPTLATTTTTYQQHFKYAKLQGFHGNNG